MECGDEEALLCNVKYDKMIRVFIENADQGRNCFKKEIIETMKKT